jgi:cold-inducible RNA-binding protein
MGKRLYVGNLSYESTADSVRTAFEAGGRTVTDVFLMTDRETGRPRGFGFVEMGSDDEAQAAIRELDGAELDGRNITVNEARERQGTGSGGGPRGPRGARGAGGGHGDGGAHGSRRGGARGGRGGKRRDGGYDDGNRW